MKKAINWGQIISSTFWIMFTVIFLIMFIDLIKDYNVDKSFSWGATIASAILLVLMIGVTSVVITTAIKDYNKS